MPYADLAGLRLYYERADSGERELLFVQSHAVTALDPRGCGRSDASGGVTHRCAAA